ncbi:TetR family transcriptional regulator [Sulfobacillus thermotolerans]|uniref:TetR/AcrR family transcriptional regulator n=1 Tax=Sulfobacillus thermotolerans TaxID=338644 RepID=UPI0033685254
MSTRTVQKHATHQKIFSTALHLFRTQGFEQTSVDQIVRAAGVSKGSFFVHFPTKKAIFTTYVDHLTDTFLPSLPKWLALPPIDGLHQATKALTQVAEQDYALLPYIIEAELLAEPWDDGRLSSLHHIFDPLITHAQSAGVVRSDLSAAQLADHWLSTFIFLGLGVGVVIMTTLTMVQLAIAPDSLGRATGFYNLARNIGNTLGPGLLAV